MTACGSRALSASVLYSESMKPSFVYLRSLTVASSVEAAVRRPTQT